MLDLVIGKRELGKTTLAVYLSRLYPTRVIFDPRHMINTTHDVLSELNIQENLYELLDTRSEIIIQPQFDKQRAFEMTCQIICDWLRDNPGEPFAFLVDEVRFVKNLEENEHFEFIVRCMPRDVVTVIMTCHGVTDIPTDLRRIADYWLLFRLTLEADVDRVRERCGESVAQAVQTLNPYEYVVWNDSRAVWATKTNPRDWYVKLEAPERVSV